MLWIGTLGVLPLAMILFDFRPAALAGCGTYGYACNQTACFTAEINTTFTNYNGTCYGGSWQKGSAWIYGQTGTTITLYVRTTMTTNVDQVEGWSFGLKHTAPTLISVDGGNLVLNAVQDGQALATIQAPPPPAPPGPPDFPGPGNPATRAWTCGLTQGVVVDFGSPGPGYITTGPNSNMVTAFACYQLTFPNNSTVHTVTLDFTEDVGTPPVSNLVARLGQTITPCKEKLTLYVQRTSYPPFTPSYCPFGQSQVSQCDGMGGGGGVGQLACFMRGDSDGNGHVQLTDTIFLLLFLFQGGPLPGCLDAADGNDSSTLDLADAIFVLTHLFRGGPVIPAPFPDCGTDPTVDILSCLTGFAGCSATDVDNDGLTCGDELNRGTDPSNADTDGDGLTDGDEVARGTDPTKPDTDGDGFTDGEEVLESGVAGTTKCRCDKRSETRCDENCTNGVDELGEPDTLADAMDPECQTCTDSGSLNIAALGANPLVPDIFVEIDYMGAGGNPVHDHKPLLAALTAVRDAFANSPNPIALHIDAGIGPDFDLSTDVLAGGQEIPHADFLSTSSDTCIVTEAIEDIKATHFNRNRCNVFRYNLWVHRYRQNSNSSGVAPVLGRDDFVVSLGGLGDNQVGSLLQQAGTFMHELGHTLNLHHGGGEAMNCKPNYVSVMNYAYQFGLVGCDLLPNNTIGYSDVVLPSLDEYCLNESAGICGGVGVNWNDVGGITVCDPATAPPVCPPPPPPRPQQCCLACAVYNINCILESDHPLAPLFGICAGEINGECDPTDESPPLRGFDDWGHLWLNFKIMPPEEICGNSTDDDGDGYTDERGCVDPQALQTESEVLRCRDVP